MGQQATVSVFYVFYILAEFPTSIFVKRLQFNRVIPLITFCWGIVCLCTGFIHSFGPLIVTRILLGFFEGCQFPAMTLLLCNWYKREELAVRVAYLFSMLQFIQPSLQLSCSVRADLTSPSRFRSFRCVWRPFGVGYAGYGWGPRTCWLAVVCSSKSSSTTTSCRYVLWSDQEKYCSTGCTSLKAS